MGKTVIPSTVDLRKFTIANSLKQIRRSNISRSEDYKPLTTSVWSCDLQPNQTKAILQVVETELRLNDTLDFRNFKRFKKRQEGNAVILTTILCSASSYPDPGELLLILNRHVDIEVSRDSLWIQEIPNEIPSSKELAIKWSNEYWPLSWKGNPNHQDLITAKFDMKEEANIIERLISHARESSGLNISTIVAKKELSTSRIEVLDVTSDDRHNHPLGHSIINAIAKIASKERTRRQTEDDEAPSGYLCHDLLVYTTHEPCDMCAMALVHSRISRLTYIWNHQLGGIESSHFIGDRNDLNWTFDIWQWVGEGAAKPLLLGHKTEP